MIERIKHFFCYYLATGLGTGFSPIASGTVGSALAIAFVMIWWPGNLFIRMAYILVTALIAVYVSGWLAEAEADKDPSIVVADEIAGQFVTFMAIGPHQLNWQSLLAGFLLFRIFDIWKPWPIRRLEYLPGGWGIVCDDLLAGFYAAVIMYLWLG